MMPAIRRRFLRVLTKARRRTMSNYKTVLSDASQLPLGERIQLIEALWDTVPEEEMPPLSDERAAKIQWRSAEFDADP